MGNRLIVVFSPLSLPSSLPSSMDNLFSQAELRVMIVFQPSTNDGAQF